MLKGKPFVKWAGGKRQIIDKLKEYAPIEFNTYYEPFVGGGSSSTGGDRTSSGNGPISGMGSNLQHLGSYIEASAVSRQNPINKSGMKTSSATTKLNRFGSRMMNAGADSIGSAVSQIMPTRSMYRRRYRNRGDS